MSLERELEESMGSKRRFAVLTGAGASVPLALPAMDGLLDDQVVAHLSESFFPIYTTAENWCAFVGGERGIDFELLYTAVEAMATMDRESPSSIPFVPHRDRRGWRFTEPGESHLIEFDKAKSLSLKLRDELRRLVHDKVGTVDADRAGELYRPLFELLFEQAYALDDATIDFFTTNYDRSVEIVWAQEQQGPKLSDVVLKRGFSQKHVHRFLEFDPAEFDESYDSDQRIVNLLKLHGGLHWIKRGDRILESPSHDYLATNALIYPLRKHAVEEPFKSLLKRFHETLGQVRVLVVIGSSLRDKHIYEELVAAMSDRSDFKVVIHDPRASAIAEKFPKRLREQVFTADGRFGSPEGFSGLRDCFFAAIDQSSG